MAGAPKADALRFITLAAKQAHPKGELFLPRFAKIGIGHVSALLGTHPSLHDGAIDDADLKKLHDALLSTNGVASIKTPQWPASTPNTFPFLRIMVLAARKMQDQEAAALTGAVGATAAMPAATATTTAASDKAALESKGGQLFTAAEMVHHPVEYAADARVSYEMVAKLHRANVTNTPIAFALAEFTLQLKLNKSQAESYEHLGKTYTVQDEAAKVAKIDTDGDLWRMMERRKQAETVAGCFDVVENAKDKGVSPPAANLQEARSKVHYVSTDASGAKVPAEMDCYATNAVQEIQIARMREFREQHPHVSVEKCVSVIDAGIQKHIANSKLKGYTGDAATMIACTKCPELYSVSLVAGHTPTAEGGETEREKGAKGKGGKNRSAEEQSASDKRRIEQLEREVKNRKAQQGKGGKGGWDGWNSGKGGWGGGKGGWNNNGWQQQANGKGGGPPGNGVACPPDVCRDFNFKVQGCTAPHNNCRFKHVCALCGANHPWRGNH